MTQRIGTPDYMPASEYRPVLHDWVQGSSSTPVTLEEFYITVPQGIPSNDTVLDWVYEHAPVDAKRPKSPLWARACVYVGSFLSVGAMGVIAYVEVFTR